MKERIKFLIQLQDFDNKINGIISRKNDGPLKIKQLGEELKIKETAFQSDFEKLEALRKDRRQIEQSIQDLDVKIEKSNSRLTQIKSNKEYSAILKEIDDLKKAKFQTEDSVIELMESIEKLETKCKKNSDLLEDFKAKFKEDKDQVSKSLKELDSELTVLEKKRETVLPSVDRELLDRYDFIKDRKGGHAVSSVVKGVCQSCHLGIPPQKFNELIKGNTLMSCPNCDRIMYWGEDEIFQ